jgi:hypothetical protein
MRRAVRICKRSKLALEPSVQLHTPLQYRRTLWAYTSRSLLLPCHHPNTLPPLTCPLPDLPLGHLPTPPPPPRLLSHYRLMVPPIPSPNRLFPNLFPCGCPMSSRLLSRHVSPLRSHLIKIAVTLTLRIMRLLDLSTPLFPLPLRVPRVTWHTVKSFACGLTCPPPPPSTATPPPSPPLSLPPHLPLLPLPPTLVDPLTAIRQPSRPPSPLLLLLLLLLFLPLQLLLLNLVVVLVVALRIFRRTIVLIVTHPTSRPLLPPPPRIPHLFIGMEVTETAKATRSSRMILT